MQEQYIFLSLSVWHLNLITEGVEGYWCIWSHSVTHTHTHTHTSHSVGLPWTSDRPDAEPSTWQHTPLTTDRHSILTFWSRNYFLNFSTPCIQNVNNTGTKYVRIMKQTAFWKGKKRRVYTMFKIFSTYICWINIQNETLEVSGAVRPL